MTGFKVAICGCTGAVGKEMIEVLAARQFPIATLGLFASARSAGKMQETPLGELPIEEFSVEKVSEYDFALFAVSGDFSRQFAPQLAAAGVTVIDNSSAFRMDDSVPLVVPEINGDAARGHKLIANPNCTTAIAAVVLHPLHREFELTKVIVSTYQATSGGGAPAMAELRAQSENYLAGRAVSNDKFAHPIPFNLIPHIDSFVDNGYTKEEMKVTHETRKIFGLPSLLLSCTAVRIPTFRAHCEAITIETARPISPAAAHTVLATAAGVEIVDDPNMNSYPMPLTATQKYAVEVGRIRQSLVFGTRGLDLFVAGDQLLKGAALNAVQIAELFV